MSDSPSLDPRPGLVRYYNLLETRLGFKFLLGGTRHFGYYGSENDWPWPISPALRRMEGKLFKALRLPDGGKVLDCGCGSGHVARFMAQHGLRVEAIDFMSRHVERAQEVVASAGLSNAVTVRQADYHHLDFFDSNAFGGLYTVETFVHATNPHKALRGFLRVLKPGGTLVLCEYGFRDWKDPKNPHRKRLKERLDIINKYGDMPSLVEKNEIPRWIKEVGFEDIQVQDLTQNVVPMMWLFWFLAVIPYMFVQLLGLEAHFPNVTAGVEMYRGKKDWQYFCVTARKPLESNDGTTL